MPKRKIEFDNSDSEYVPTSDSSVSETSDSDTDIVEEDDDGTELETNEKSTRKKIKIGDNMVFYFNDEDFEDPDNEEKALEQLKKDDPQAYENFIKVKEDIEKKTPNIVNILKLPIHLKDKSRLFELYEIFKMTDNPTLEWVELRNCINRLQKQFLDEYREYSSYTEDEKKELEELSKIYKHSQTKTSMKRKILLLNTNEQNKAAIYKKFCEWDEMKPDDHDYFKLKNWLLTAIGQPFDNIKPLPKKSSTNFSKYLRKVLQRLDKELYGMQSVKEQIMLFLNTKLSNPEMTGCSIGLVGPPGVGKTTIAKCLAKALEWPFEQICFGGIRDVSFLKGHDYTYVGSQAGEISRCLSRMKYKNGILFLDEYEKISDNKSITSFLLHLTDFQQNSTYREHYLSEITQDLSKLWFIYSMNSLPEDKALRDRIYTIEVPGYSLKEKKHILVNYTLPKMLKNIGIAAKQVSIDENVAEYFIKKIDDKEKGIRNLENATKNFLNKVDFLVKHQNKKGKLVKFDCITFNYTQKLKYPLKITKELVEAIIKEKSNADKEVLSTMYL